MPEKFESGIPPQSGGSESSPENLEDQKYRELQEATEEQNRIMREIEKVLASTPDKDEAEKIIIEKWAPLMDEATKKLGEASTTWFNAIHKTSKRERKEIDDMEKDLGKE